MIYKYGIDFGTTNSSIAIRFIGDDQLEHTLVVDVKDTLPRETIPSVILADDSGKIVAGEDALNQYIQGTGNRKKQRFIKQIKLDLERKGSKLEYNINGKIISGIDMIAAILKVLRLKAEKVADELEIKMSGVVFGVPVQYGDIQKNILKQALVKSGFYGTLDEAEHKTEFVSEPIAVAIHYGLNLKHDTTVLVFDFGGGTLDLAIVNLKNQVAADKLHPHETISKERITLGGEELTRLFFINSFCNPKKYGPKRIGSEFGFGTNLTPEQLWKKLLQCEDGIRFISAVEKCKCDLSKASKYKFSFIGRNIQIEEQTFYRDDFSNAIEDKLDEIDSLIETCLENGNIQDPYDIDHVILAGGSSMIPVVQDLLVDKFGANRVSSKLTENDTFIKSYKKNKAIESEVLTSIVRGLAMVGCKDESYIDDTVESDYGVWDSVKNEFIPIICKGVLVKETFLDRITYQGIYEEVECLDKNVSSVEIKVYQKNLTGEHRLGTINIPNPGGEKYRIYMQIDKKQGILEVIIFDIVQQRWIDEIPLNERQYTLR
jgi:molecular chaperone DnaK (HSP70)